MKTLFEKVLIRFLTISLGRKLNSNKIFTFQEEVGSLGSY